jgi:hypothetical protein
MKYKTLHRKCHSTPIIIIQNIHVCRHTFQDFWIFNEYIVIEKKMEIELVSDHVVKQIANNDNVYL